jgi:hypothetical protein
MYLHDLLYPDPFRCRSGSKLQGPQRVVCISSQLHFGSKGILSKYMLFAGPKKKRERNMSVRIGKTAPDFEADTTMGSIKFDDWAGDA